MEGKIATRFKKKMEETLSKARQLGGARKKKNYQLCRHMTGKNECLSPNI